MALMVLFGSVAGLPFLTGFLCIPLILCTFWHTNRRAPFYMAALGTILLASGMILPSDTSVNISHFLNTLLAVFGFFVTAALVYLIKSTDTNSLENEKRLKSILDNTVDGIITIDELGNIETFNMACEKMFGYQAQEVIGKNVKILMPDPYQAEHDEYLQNYRTTGVKKIIGIGREVSGKRKDGQIFPIDLSVSEVKIHGRRIFSGIVRDISEVQEAQKRLAAILDNTVDGLITIDQWGSIETFNKACEGIFGYKADEVLGKNVKILMPEPYSKEHDSYLSNYHRTGEKKIIGIGREVKGKKKDGTTFPIDLSISEVEVMGRKIYSGIVRNIAERKQAEEEIMRSNEELERFAYIASHDLQEPLRMVYNFTHLLDEEYGAGMDGQAKEYMRFILDSSLRMQNMVADLLEYSRIGSEDAGLSEFSCAEQIAVVLENLENSIKDSGAVITVAPLPKIHGNALRFSRLVQNLISNAIKYCDGSKNPQINIHAEDSETHWVFRIQDNGIGIKPEFLKQIFIIFKRLHNKKEYSGTGIGLAVCKKIVESFGGEIWAESEYGKGSTFCFTVPKRLQENSKKEEKNDRE